jgi:hypothetical protein
MNCEKCQNLLSDFLDGHLSDEEHSSFSAHLEECLPCYSMRDEMDSIVSYCRDHRGEYDSPPNSQALWLRIRNTIESDRSAATASSYVRPTRASENWWSRLMNRSWELSLPQMTGAVCAIIIAVSLATVYGIRHTQVSSEQTSAPGVTTASSTSAPQVRKSSLAASATEVDDRLRQRQVAIDYWNDRVEQRKARWNPQIREAFDRNMDVINQQVEYSRQELQRNPHDEISEEMLNDALNYKMELLKEFSDQ